MGLYLHLSIMECLCKTKIITFQGETMFRRFTISVGNLIATLAYVLSLIGIIIVGLLAIATQGLLLGLGIIVGGVLLLVLIFYGLFLFIDNKGRIE